jgi:hypothetical protein
VRHRLSPTGEEARYVINYWIGDRQIHQDEHGWIPPQIEQGFVTADGDRYRVVDVWVVGEKHGPTNYGVHAFLEPAVSKTDGLGAIFPDYYKDYTPGE